MQSGETPERARGAVGRRGYVLLKLKLCDRATVFNFGQEAGLYDR